MMTTRLRLFWATVLIGWAVLIHADPGSANAQDDKMWLMNQINNLRASLGIHAYVWNGQLAAAAQQQSEYMAATGNISHVHPDGSSPSSRAAANGYGGSWIIENIYGGSIATASDAWAFWINSGVHYSGLVNTNTNEIGIGVASGGNGNYYTLVFGKGNINPPPAQVVNNPEPAGQQPVNGEPAAPSINSAPAIAPTRRPPPTRTFTPSPTVPTFTPSATWTFTPLWTQSPTYTPVPATSTAISLPTAVALAPTVNTDVPSPEAILPTATFSLEATPEPDTLAPNTNQQDSPLRRLLPYLIAGQVAFIGLGLGSMFMHRKR